MTEQMRGSGKIKAQLKTAGQGVGSTRTGLRPQSDITGRSPVAMMPWAGRAMLRAVISCVPAATLGGGR